MVKQFEMLYTCIYGILHTHTFIYQLWNKIINIIISKDYMFMLFINFLMYIYICYKFI